MKRHIFVGWIACVVGLAPFAHSQALPTATRSGGGLQIGVGGSAIRTDLDTKHADSFNVYGTIDFTTHIGVEGDIRLSVITPGHIGENNYLLGPRYVLNYGRFQPYVKVLGGIGSTVYKFPGQPIYTSRHPMFALGGGLDIKVTRKINVRFPDVEYQDWPTFKDTGLHPLVVGFGVAYAFR